MQDLKKLTLKALKDLARKKLGSKVASLRTKADLIAALRAAVPEPVKRAVGKVRKKVKTESEPPAEKPKPAAKPRTRRSAEPRSARPAIPPAQEAAPASAPAEPAVAAARRAKAPVTELLRTAPRPPRPAACAAPAEEGIAPSGKGIAAYSKGIAPSGKDFAASSKGFAPSGFDLGFDFDPNFDEDLGDLPESYGEDTVTLLPRDPHTLWLYWDFCRETLDEAFAWMPGLHTRLRLFADDKLVREVDFSIESKSWYLGDLAPARTYRAELWALAIDGQARRIGPPSNEMKLPPEQPSPHVDDRFLRIVFDLPRAAAPAPQVLVPSEPFPPAAREALYQASGGGLARAIGSSEQDAARQGADSPGGMLRTRGPWPWSGSFPRRS
jgi:hypothetical protein